MCMMKLPRARATVSLQPPSTVSSPECKVVRYFDSQYQSSSRVHISAFVGSFQKHPALRFAVRIPLVLGIRRFRGRPKASAPAAGSPVSLSLRDVLKISGFKRLWLAQIVSILGDFLALFGVINLITFKWHGTPLQVTNVMIAFIIPMAIVGPLAGVFVDRWNVKRTMIVSDLIRAAPILGLVFVTRLEQIRTVLHGEHGIELLWPVAIRNVAHTSPGERTDVSECAHVSGVLHDAYHRSGGGGFAGVLAWVQFVLLSGQRQLFLLCCDALDNRNRAHGKREGCNRENRGLAEEGLHGWVEVHPDASCDFLRHDRDDDRDVCA